MKKAPSISSSAELLLSLNLGVKKSNWGKLRGKTLFVYLQVLLFHMKKRENRRKKAENLMFPAFSFGSGRRIRTLTYGVRVRCATITQSRYIALFAALCRSANIRYYSRNFAFVNRKFSKKSKFGKFLSLPHFPVTSRWRTNAAAARTCGAGRCAWPTPSP